MNDNNIPVRDLHAERAQRRYKGAGTIANLKKLEGYAVQEFSPYHFRINGKVDLWPTNCRFHDLVTGARGFYPAQKLNDLVAFVDLHTATPEAKPVIGSVCLGCQNDTGKPGQFLCGDCRHKHWIDVKTGASQ